MYCSSSVKDINSSFTSFMTYGCLVVQFPYSSLLFPPLKSVFLAWLKGQPPKKRAQRKSSPGYEQLSVQYQRLLRVVTLPVAADFSSVYIFVVLDVLSELLRQRESEAAEEAIRSH